MHSFLLLSGALAVSSYPRYPVKTDLFCPSSSSIDTLETSPVGSVVENPPAMQEMRVRGLGRSPGGGNEEMATVFLPVKFHGQRRLGGYSPWGSKESDTTGRLSSA